MLRFTSPLCSPLRRRRGDGGEVGPRDTALEAFLDTLMIWDSVANCVGGVRRLSAGHQRVVPFFRFFAVHCRGSQPLSASVTPLNASGNRQEVTNTIWNRVDLAASGTRAHSAPFGLSDRNRWLWFRWRLRAPSRGGSGRLLRRVSFPESPSPQSLPQGHQAQHDGHFPEQAHRGA